MLTLYDDSLTVVKADRPPHLQVVVFPFDPPCFEGCAFCADDLAEARANQLPLPGVIAA